MLLNLYRHTHWSYFQLCPVSQWSPAKSVDAEVDWVTWQEHATVAKLQVYHHTLQFAKLNCRPHFHHHSRGRNKFTTQTQPGNMRACMKSKPDMSFLNCFSTVRGATHTEFRSSVYFTENIIKFKLACHNLKHIRIKILIFSCLWKEKSNKITIWRKEYLTILCILSHFVVFPMMMFVNMFEFVPIWD